MSGARKSPHYRSRFTQISPLQLRMRRFGSLLGPFGRLWGSWATLEDPSRAGSGNPSLTSGIGILDSVLERIPDARDGFPAAQLLVSRPTKPSMPGDDVWLRKRVRKFFYSCRMPKKNKALGRFLGGSWEALGGFWEEKRNKKTLPKQDEFSSFPLLFLPYISK